MKKTVSAAFVALAVMPSGAHAKPIFAPVALRRTLDTGSPAQYVTRNGLIVALTEKS
jgi:hypothetical protein